MNKKHISEILKMSFFISLLLLYCISSNAQKNSTEEYNLRIIYIDHEPSLPSGEIIKYIRNQRRNAREMKNSLIIYMPNNETPFISLTNLKSKDGSYESQEAFDRICEALNTPFHGKEPIFDRNYIINLFDDYNIVNKEGKINFASVRMQFYLTSEFWKQGYNESIVAPIFFAINGKELLKQNFNFDVYINPNDKPVYPSNAPFGETNLGNINQHVSLYDYDY